MQDPALLEFEVLSEDRRRAVDIFVKGYLLVMAIVAFAVNTLLQTGYSLSRFTLWFILIVGGALGVPYWLKCKKHDAAIRRRLDEIGRERGIAPIVSTSYIFDAPFLFGLAVWCGLVILLVFNLDGAVPGSG